MEEGGGYDGSHGVWVWACVVGGRGNNEQHFDVVDQCPDCVDTCCANNGN